MPSERFCFRVTDFSRQAEAERRRSRQTCQSASKFTTEPTKAITIMGMRIASICNLSAILTTPRAEAKAAAPIKRRILLSAINALQTLWIKASNKADQLSHFRREAEGAAAFSVVSADAIRIRLGATLEKLRRGEGRSETANGVGPATGIPRRLCHQDCPRSSRRRCRHRC